MVFPLPGPGSTDLAQFAAKAIVVQQKARRERPSPFREVSFAHWARTEVRVGDTLEEDREEAAHGTLHTL